MASAMYVQSVTRFQTSKQCWSAPTDEPALASYVYHLDNLSKLRDTLFCDRVASTQVLVESRGNQCLLPLLS